MFKAICWNARSINTQGSLNTLQNLKTINNLDLDKAVSNPNGKIWMLSNTDMNCEVLELENQHITCVLFNMSNIRGHLFIPLYMQNATYYL